MTDTGSMQPSDEALAWQQRADAWAQQAESENGQAVVPASRWTEVASTGRPTLSKDGVGWRTETAEWRATGARWRQTTEWRSTTGSHGWRSTTEAWQTGGSSSYPPVGETPMSQPAISSAAWSPSADSPTTTGTDDSGPAWQRFAGSSPDSPLQPEPWRQAQAEAWQQAQAQPTPQSEPWHQGQAGSGQPEPWQQAQAEPWQQPDFRRSSQPWQQPDPSQQAQPAPWQQEQPWQQQARSEPWQQEQPWQQQARSEPWQQQSQPETRRPPEPQGQPETQGQPEPWQQYQPWQRSEQRQPTPPEPWQQQVPGPSAASSSSWSYLAEPIAAQSPPSQPSGSEPASNWRNNAIEGTVTWADPMGARSAAPDSSTGWIRSAPAEASPVNPATSWARSGEPTEPPGRPPWRDDGRHLVREDDRATWRGPAATDLGGSPPQIGRRRAAETPAGGTGWAARSDNDNWAGHADTGGMHVYPSSGTPDTPGWGGGSGRYADPVSTPVPPNRHDAPSGRRALPAAPHDEPTYRMAPARPYDEPGRRRRYEDISGARALPAGGRAATPARRGEMPDRYEAVSGRQDDGLHGRRPEEIQGAPQNGYPTVRRVRPADEIRGQEFEQDRPPQGGRRRREADDVGYAAESTGSRGYPQSRPTSGQGNGRANYHQGRDDWREQTSSWAAEPDTSSWTRDPDTGQWSRSEDDPRVLAWRDEAVRREAMGEAPVPRRALPGPADARRDGPEQRRDTTGRYDDDEPGSGFAYGERSGSAPRSALPYEQGPGDEPRRGGRYSGTPYSSGGAYSVAPASAVPGSAPRSAPGYAGSAPVGDVPGVAPRSGGTYGSARSGGAYGAPAQHDIPDRGGRRWAEDDEPQPAGRRAALSSAYDDRPPSRDSWRADPDARENWQGPPGDWRAELSDGPGVAGDWRAELDDRPAQFIDRPGAGDWRAESGGPQQAESDWNGQASDWQSESEPAWMRSEREEVSRGARTYRAGADADWRNQLADRSNLADGESHRFGASDYIPFQASSSAAAPRSPDVSMSSLPVVAPMPRAQHEGVRPQRSSNGFQGPSGSYERRAVTGGFPTSRRSNLLDPDDEEDEQESAGPVAAVGYTVIWYGVPVVLFLAYMLVVNTGEQTHALDTLAKAAPQFGLSLVLSLIIAVGIRRVSNSWKAVTVGLAAAVVGGGLATVLTSAITGNSLS